MYLRIGKPDESRFNNYEKRMDNIITVAFGQTKLLREPYAGVLHVCIFWGFNILLLAVLESIGEGLFSGFSFSFLGGLYAPLIFLEDALAFLVVVAVLLSFIRRFVFVPKRLQGTNKEKTEAALVLIVIFCIMFSMFGQNAARMFAHPTSSDSSRLFSSLFAPIVSRDAHFWFSFYWWMHIVFVFGFLNFLPYSKHLHIFTSFFNVYFAKLSSRGTLKPLFLEDENATKFGANDVEDLSWKQLLDGYTCTECGRCTDSCPANITGKPLSPKKIIEDIRKRTMEKAPFLSHSNNGEHAAVNKTLLDGYISEEELWACTTCMACVQECPVQIEHIDSIVDMRRYLVLNESRIPKEAQTTFSNLERNFTPWNFSHAERTAWAQGLNVPTFAEKHDAEILFWVGCAGSYDARYIKVTQAFVKILQQAKIDFAILGLEEKCNGDVARRLGNEYLAQMSMRENIETMKKYHFKKIVTSCPHCFNIFKNEYPQFGGNYSVLHHTELISQLLEDGRMALSNEITEAITYHDSCYIGRYNDNYDAPRKILQSIRGVQVHEMPRSRDKGFCCGAGGGRMFLEETTGKRVNIERTEEALSLHPSVIATACPFCMTMLTDGVKAKEASEGTNVRDVAEIVSEAMQRSNN
jgi:Fe-S oxidoreductase